MIKLETVLYSSGEANDDSIVKQEGLLNEKTSKMNNSGKPVASLKRK